MSSGSFARRIRIACALGLSAVLTTCAYGAGTVTPTMGLIGHWKLDSDCRDYSGNEQHGVNHAAAFDGKSARFDGVSSYIEVPHSDALALDSGDFSVSVWVHTEAVLDDVIGDILSKFSPVTRKGFNLNLKHHAGMTSSQSNYRNLHFGIDDGSTEPVWKDLGQLGTSIFICSMAVHDGGLYVGTFESAADKAGHVFRAGDDESWVDCGSPDKSNSVMSMAEYRGQLYVGTAKYNAKGSALPASPNETPGGHVYRLEADGSWTDCGRLAEAKDVYAMAVYKDELYAIPMYTPGVFRWDGETGWEYCGTPGDMRSMSLAVYNGYLYSSGNGSAGVWRYEGGTDWTFCGKQEEETQTYAFAMHRGDMYTGTWPSAFAMRYVDGEEWVNCGSTGEEKEIMAMAVYNGMMYAGTLPLGQVYRYDGPDNWTLVGEIDSTPDVLYRRVWTMAVHDGKLYAGTLPAGHVWSTEVGKNATWDAAFPAGWRHIGAVREAGCLKLYVDGELVATSSTFGPGEMDIANEEPLRIGLGSHDYLNGRLADLRLYSRALSGEDIAALKSTTSPAD